MKKYSVFIPFYNEEKILESNALNVYQYLKSAKYDFELHLVDDHSTDKSFAIARNLAKRYPEIKTMSFEFGPSRRENLFQQFQKVKSEVIAFTDVDLAVPVRHFDKLFEELIEGNADVCIGSRYEAGSTVKRELWRRIISVCYTKIIRSLFACPVTDFQCGFKAFKRQALKEVIEELGYDHSSKRGWFLDAEFLIRAHLGGKKITMIPVEWNCGKRSTFRIMRELKMVPYIFSLWWKLRGKNGRKL
jgi:hypothetical protein